MWGIQQIKSNNCPTFGKFIQNLILNLFTILFVKYLLYNIGGV